VKWPIRTLAELAGEESNSFVDGPFGSNLKASEYKDSGIPIVRLQNVRPNQFLHKDIKFISERKAALLKRHDFRSGDLIIAKLGDPCAVACIVPKGFPEGRLVADVVRFRGRPGVVEHRYVAYFLNSPSAQAQVEAATTGTTRKRVNLGRLKSLVLPLPPLEEQRRIAEVLDQAEALRAKRRAALALLDSLTQSIFLDLFGNPVMNLKNWKECPVGDITDCIVPGRDKPKSFSGQIPWITTDDLFHLEPTFISSKSLGLNSEEISEVRAKIIPKGSVIFSCVGDLGIISIASTDLVINQQLHSFQCHENLNHVFLMHCLTFQKAYMYAKASSTTVPYMNKSVCNSIPVIVPPIEMQREFARRVEAVAKLRAAHRSSLEKLDALFATLQNRAFKGELFDEKEYESQVA
jgi:type I restriction enzyme S subunit